MINKIKEILKPNKKDFWGHIADARVNKNNPDYELIAVTDRLTELHNRYCFYRGLDPLEVPIHHTVNRIDYINHIENL